jgi:hypothetical protein
MKERGGGGGQGSSQGLGQRLGVDELMGLRGQRVMLYVRSCQLSCLCFGSRGSFIEPVLPLLRLNDPMT